MGTKSSEVAAPVWSTGRVEEKTSTVQAGSLKSRKVMVPDLAPLGPRRVAASRTAVPSGPPCDAVATTVWLALVTVMVKVWHAVGETPLLAHTVVGPNVPASVGLPTRSPFEPRLRPGGRVPVVTLKVAAGVTGVEVNWWA